MRYICVYYYNFFLRHKNICLLSQELYYNKVKEWKILMGIRLRGIVKDNGIVLEKPLNFPEGTEVTGKIITRGKCLYWILILLYCIL